jgi:hypothetical protein
MALVSVCIGVVFLFPVIGGTSLAYNTEVLRPRNEREFEKGLAIARINRCLTLPGALDTYAKGLMHNNGIYIAIASPLEKQEELAEHMYGRVDRLDQQFIYDYSIGTTIFCNNKLYWKAYFLHQYTFNTLTYIRIMIICNSYYTN